MNHCTHDTTPLDATNCPECGQEMLRICSCGCNKPYTKAVTEAMDSMILNRDQAEAIIRSKMVPIFKGV